METFFEDDVAAIMVSAAAEAGELLLRGFSDMGKKIGSKSGRELVTEYDIASEELIKKRLKPLGFPAVAEESGGSAVCGRYWAIDPLDGTNNFAYGIPHFAVTFALMDSGMPAAGVIYDPVREEMYTSVAGKGAFLNGLRIRVSSRAALSDAIAATGFAYDRKKGCYDNIGNISRVVEKCRGLRRMGAASLDLAYVAAGRFDAYWERGLRLWDMAAGLLMVKEAGGRVSGLNGECWDAGGDHILASNGITHEQIREMLDKYDH